MPFRISLAWLAFLLAALIAPASAQTIPGLSFSTPAPAASSLPSAPVEIDGQTLFTVATGSADQLPVATRAADIEDVFAQILAASGSGSSAHTVYNPATMHVGIERHGSVDVLDVVDAGHRDPMPIVTVTSADAQAHQMSADELAAQWQETLQGALMQALLIRQPRTQQAHLEEAVIAGIAVVLLTLAGYGGVLGLGRRIDALVSELEARQSDMQAAGNQPPSLETPAAEAHRRHLTALSLQSLKPERKLALYRAVRGLVLWSLLLLWFAAAAWATMLFPQTSILGHSLVANGFAIALIWAGTGLLDRVLAIMIGRLPAVWDLRHYANADERTRQTLRIPTIVQAMNGFKTVVLVFLALLATMTQLGIPVGSVVTIGGLAAVAVSLAAQNLIRDIVSGFLVLAEDQFVVGDFVTINGASGLVERLTLRMVQIRDGSGSLVTISNSAATSVINHSRNWSRVDYAISIDPAADVSRAIDLLHSTITDLQSDPAWHESFVDPVEWIGVEGLSRDGIVIRARIKTAPLRQFALQRELNLRVSKAFAEAKIPFGAAVPAT
jgi:moderate conductance mechanosensitive channel